MISFYLAASCCCTPLLFSWRPRGSGIGSSKCLDQPLAALTIRKNPAPLRRGQVREKAAQSPTCRETDHGTIRSSWTKEFRLRIIPLEPKRGPQRRGYSGRLRRDYCCWRTTFRPIRAMILPFAIDAPDLRGVSTLRPARCTARRTRNTRRLTPSTKAPSQLFPS
jgi:hypothetical protein